MSMGFRVITTIKRPPLKLVEKFLDCRSCDLSDVMNRAGTMVGIHGVYSPIARVAGPAVTVSIPAGGINMVKLGIEQARSGDVMVVSAQGDTTYALMGGNISLGMQARGIRGFVIDGGVRDVSELRQLAFPTFARGIACAAADLGPPRGEINVPVACGGVVVNPGDIIIADEDGVVVVPAQFANEVLAGMPALSAQHEKAREILRTGQMTSIERITDDFVNQGLEIVPGHGESTRAT
jgi:4-hydroxy-4-methyl-2-oxoglutarate aldolase